MAGTQKPCVLELMNLHDPAEFERLRQHRVLCGWNHDPAKIKKWREGMDRKVKSMFWIMTCSDTSPQCIGHVSLDSEAEPLLDLEVANPDRSVLTIANFFIVMEYRSRGLSSVVMDIIEGYATREPHGSPDCKAVTVHTTSKRYTDDDGEEWRGIWAQLGHEAPVKGSRTNEGMYARRGYVKWKEQPLYPEQTPDGRKIMLVAAYMRKALE